jgi:hypothetical protein
LVKYDMKDDDESPDEIKVIWAPIQAFTVKRDKN